ncbi:hypothetical protein H4S07_001067 [Coemansia furcata]|uniref:Uncharacterized protein n=1 Tax=Coemansia furcata TaxID=417177 RepID=A0ACC1LQC5_9FUNG|nr:hypothetical protein H4S07_001067 [Coemansia furcata]
MSDNDISMTPGTQGVLRALTKLKYQEFLCMLPPLIPKDKEEDKSHVIAVGPWLDNCEEIFRVSDVPDKWHSSLAQHSIPLTKGQQFRQWCKENHREDKMPCDSDNWADFSEYMYMEYSGTISTLDAYAKWKALDAPRNSAKFEKFIEKFKIFARMAKYPDDSPHVAMEFITRMPPALFQTILAQSNSKDVLALPALIAMANPSRQGEYAHTTLIFS